MAEMPTPMGHALGGMAAAFLADAAVRRHQLTPGLLLASAALAMAPDLDLLIGSHRTHTHSLGAACGVGIAAWLIARRRGRDAVPTAAILMAAYGSHLVLDWTGKDTSSPPGLMIAWPFSSAFHVSGLNLFGEVSRRYWLPAEFVFGNVGAVAWEMLVLVPLFLLAWAVWSKRTLGGVRKRGEE